MDHGVAAHEEDKNVDAGTLSPLKPAHIDRQDAMVMETQYVDNKQDTQMIEKINFNTHEDDPNDIKNQKEMDSNAMLELLSQEDAKAIEIEQPSGHSHNNSQTSNYQNRSSTIMISEEDENVAHLYVEGMINNFKHKAKVMAGSKNSLSYHPNEELDASPEGGVKYVLFTLL